MNKKPIIFSGGHIKWGADFRNHVSFLLPRKKGLDLKLKKSFLEKWIYSWNKRRKLPYGWKRQSLTESFRTGVRELFVITIRLLSFDLWHWRIGGILNFSVVGIKTPIGFINQYVLDKSKLNYKPIKKYYKTCKVT